MKRAVLYLRVSTQDQTMANQERELRQVAERAGWEVLKVYKDHGISGARSKDKRPAFDALHKAAARREFDVVMAWSVDRLGRSLQDLVGFLSEIHAAGVDLFLHQQGLDTTMPAGKAMLQMLGVFAEFERSIIQERVRAGLRRAVSEGKQLGRPRIAADIEARISAALKARRDTGDSIRKDRSAVRRRSQAVTRALEALTRIGIGRLSEACSVSGGSHPNRQS
jgi:DNA invertase Pin-like site-specific DNA recombinase